LRKLRSAYTGNCIEVRRSSDNTTQNIGFVNNVLDTASLLSFVGAGSGFVRTWYDQSGNIVNGSQTDNNRQLRIVNSGVLETLNSKPCLNTFSINDIRNFVLGLSNLQNLPVTILSAFKIDTLPNNPFNQATFSIGGNVFLGGGGRYEQVISNLNINSTQRRNSIGANAFTSINETFSIPKIFASYFTTSQIEMRLNGVDATPVLYSGTAFNTASNFSLINGGGGREFHGAKRFFEQIIFFNDKHSDRVAIESNINSFYNIY
jgi:hypothetical protein